MPIPYNVSRVLTYFQRRIQAYDIVGSLSDYEFSKTYSQPYSFVGVLIPPTNKDLSLFDEGELATGALVVYVPKTVTLHMADAVTSVQNEQRQTIVLFDGDEYRVKGLSNRDSDGLHKKYTLVRFMEGRTNVRP